MPLPPRWPGSRTRLPAQRRASRPADTGRWLRGARHRVGFPMLTSTSPVLTPNPSGVPVPRVVVDVMLKPEILDPQGQAVANALPRLGVTDVSSVRIGRRVEIDFT